MDMLLSDYGIIFSGGMAVGIVLMSIAHLLGVVIHLFKNIVETR